MSVTWANSTIEVTGFNWGKVRNATAYVMDPINITNIEDDNVTLTLTTQDRSDSILALDLAWNYTGTILRPSESVIVELEQTITATGDWTYTAVITAEAA